MHGENHLDFGYLHNRPRLRLWVVETAVRFSVPANVCVEAMRIRQLVGFKGGVSEELERRGGYGAWALTSSSCGRTRGRAGLVRQELRLRPEVRLEQGPPRCPPPARRRPTSRPLN
ncbi:hypothetical protein Nm8I071_23650 [Nonomuraea sp. TT08I-71]|nr:hypothetical protein Nm8I071_23650 [Nonomuraea sp. TT08I-71]